MRSCFKRHRIIASLLTGILCLFLANSRAQSFAIDTVLYNGNPGKFINLVFMGDGFREEELSNYLTNTQNLTNYIFSSSPFREYKNYFNVFAIRIPSEQSGANHPANAGDEGSPPSQPPLTVTNYFNSTFDAFGIHRLLVAQNNSGANAVLINNFPLFDQPLMLVNTSFYGGSGGFLATSSLNVSAYEILVHEMGHSFAGLADEYFAGDIYSSEKPNMTQETNPALIKWKKWIGSGGVGIYQYCCGGNSSQWYKPSQNCKMQYLGREFCPVCRETIIEKIHQLFGSPLLAHSPANTSGLLFCQENKTFRIELAKPAPNTLKVRWLLNGTPVGGNSDTLSISVGQLAESTNQLTAEVSDTNTFSRSDNHPALHTYSVSWTLNRSLLATPEINPPGPLSICPGDSVTLVSGNAFRYQWSNGDTAATITTRIPGIYTVTQFNDSGCSATSLPVSVTAAEKPGLGSDKSLLAICNEQTIDISNIYNTAGLSVRWSVRDSTAAPIGIHELIATNASGCSDTAYVSIMQKKTRWLGTQDNNWHNPENWSGGKVPDEKTHVVIEGNTPNPCVIFETSARAASVVVKNRGDYRIDNEREINITGGCASLPEQ
jgi:hypothetical protein